jgi:hypothetical protein
MLAVAAPPLTIRTLLRLRGPLLLVASVVAVAVSLALLLAGLAGYET